MNRPEREWMDETEFSHMTDSRRWRSSSILIRTLLFSMLAAVAIALLAWAYLQLRIDDERGRIRVEAAHHVKIQAAVLSSDLRLITYFLSFLNDQIQTHSLLDADDDDDDDQASLGQDLLSMMHKNDLFDQIRFIDASGMERLRVNAGAQGAVIANTDALQFKGNTYYFRAAMALAPGGIYISRLDLNMERGRVQRPFKPVIRFAMQVPGADGKPAGIVVINHKAQDMLDRYRRATLPGAGMAMLLNRDGYWLSHPDPTKQWGFMFADGAGLNMAETAPDMWARISRSEQGQFEYRGGIVSFGTVYPFASIASASRLATAGRRGARYWKVVSQFHADALSQLINPIRHRVAWTAAFIWLLLSLLIASTIRGQARKKQATEQQLRMHHQIQSLSQHLMRAAEQERAAITRSLHDEFGQMLSVIQMRAEVAEEKLRTGDNDSVIAYLHKIEHAAIKLMDATRSTLKRLQPGHLQELGLIEAVKDMCDEWRHSGRIDIALSVHGEIAPVPEPVALHLYRIAQEALTNIVRHAQASRADIDFLFEDGQLILTIRDNGCGFDVHARAEGLGLIGISQHVEIIHGALRLESVPGNGTTLTATAPLAAAEAHDEDYT